MRRIEELSLWVGHRGDLRNLRGVLSAGIVAVIDLAMEEPPAPITREIAYCRFPLVDGIGNPPWLLRAAIDCIVGLLRSSTPTLICCGAGMSRAPCIAAGALACVRGCTAEEALLVVAKSGPVDLAPGLWAEVKAMLD